MPYSGPNDEKLPSNVKSLPAKKRRQWIHVYESAVEKGASESSAFAQANGVAGKDKGYIESWDVYGRQVSADEAEYNAVGGNVGGGGDERACANCNWYVLEEDACVLVSGGISPTGISKFWMAKPLYEMQPMPVVIVEGDAERSDEATIRVPSPDRYNEYIEVGKIDGNDNKSAVVQNQRQGFNFSAIMEAIKDFLMPPAHRALATQPRAVGNNLTLIKSADGRTRWLSTFTNQFIDRHKEIISSDAHKEYVEWVNRAIEDRAPELWLWHTYGTKFGKADFVDYVDGFVVASGLIDDDKLEVAERLKSYDGEIATSHGFVWAARSHDGIINWYRSYEISALPAIHASNQFTDFQMLEKDDVMGFTDTRKAFLKDTAGLTDDQIKDLETNLESTTNALKAAGVKFKDDAESESEAQQAEFGSFLVELNSTLAPLTTAMTNLTERISNVEKSFDEKIEEAFTAKVSALKGYDPTTVNNTVITGEQQKEIVPPSNDWFMKEVIQPIASQVGGSQ